MYSTIRGFETILLKMMLRDLTIAEIEQKVIVLKIVSGCVAGVVLAFSKWLNP